jgi:hypothetical protein
MNEKAQKPATDGALEEAKRIMKRLVETPHKPHEPIGKEKKKKANTRKD